VHVSKKKYSITSASFHADAYRSEFHNKRQKIQLATWIPRLIIKTMHTCVCEMEAREGEERRGEERARRAS
jgi:hypothetical protein